jgi:hypothetical protein
MRALLTTDELGVGGTEILLNYTIHWLTGFDKAI